MSTTVTTQIYNAPKVDTLTAPTQPVAAAVAESAAVLVAPRAGIITAVTYSPIALITGVVTNNRTISLYNVTQTVTIASLTFAAGTNAAAGADTPLTLSGTVANTQVNAGDVLSFVGTVAGTGLADPGGVLAVTLSGVDSHVANVPYFENPAVQPSGSDALHLGVLST